MTIYHYHAELMTENGEVCQRTNGAISEEHPINTLPQWQAVSSRIERSCRKNYLSSTKHLRFNLVNLSRLN